MPSSRRSANPPSTVPDREPPPKVAGYLQYSVRRYGWIAIALTIAIAFMVDAVGQRFGVDETLYEARSIVVAEVLEIPSDELARTAYSVFAAGEVARRTAESPNVPYEASDLIPGYLDLDPVDGTIVLEVVGVHPDPSTAKAISDTAASALTVELNRVGPGLGVFRVHTASPVPDAPSTSALPTLRIGLVAGILAAISLIALKFTFSQPLLRPFEAAAAADVHLLGELTVGANDPMSDPGEIPRLTATAEALSLEPGTTRFLVGTHISSSRMSALGWILARAAASKGGQVVLVDPTRKGRRAQPTDTNISRQVDGGYIPYRDDITLFIARHSSPLSWRSPSVDIRPELGPVTLVIGAGASWRQIRSARESLAGKIDGIVFVHLPKMRDIAPVRYIRNKLTDRAVDKTASE